MTGNGDLSRVVGVDGPVVMLVRGRDGTLHVQGAGTQWASTGRPVDPEVTLSGDRDAVIGPWSSHGEALSVDLVAEFSREAFEALLHAGRRTGVGPVVLSQSMTRPVPARTFSFSADGIVWVRNPAFPRPTGRRRPGESRAGHAGRRFVATALRRRARRRRVPETVRARRTVTIPNAYLIRADETRFVVGAAARFGWPR